MEILKAFLTVYCIISVTFTTFFLINLFRNIRKELDIVKGVDTVKKTMKLVYVEEVCGMFHMYDIATHSFICQAYTEEELWATAKTKFPDMKVVSLEKDAK